MLHNLDHKHFDTDLFALHDLPLSAYIEPAGYARIALFKRVRWEAYERHLPLTTSLAHHLYSAITERDKWGRQIQWRGQGQWVSEVKYERYATKGGRTRPGHSIGLREVLRALSRADVYAVARTDSHVVQREEDRFRPGELRSRDVGCLLLDVDMDAAWLARDNGPIQHELAIERHLARLIGLPYRAFRTGGRGHQAVMPLPRHIPRSAASWLMTAYTSLLGPHHAASHWAKADATNLYDLVRIAGGRHVGTGRLALWIDPDTGRLYDLPAQIELMRTGYYHSGDGPLTPDVFNNAAREIASYLESKIHPRHLPLSRERGEIMFWLSLKELPDNPLVCRFVLADEEWGGWDDTAAIESRSVIKPVVPTTSPVEWKTQQGLTAWAQRVWDMPLDVGTFWSWISEGGHRAITAAKVLFGEAALTKLLERVDQTPDIPRARAQDRRRKVAQLYADHVLRVGRVKAVPVVVTGELQAGAEALVPTILAAVAAKKRLQTRNRADMEHVVRVILLALQQSDCGYVDLSLDVLTESIKRMWSEATTDRSTVARLLKRVKQDEEGCGFSLVQDIFRDRSGFQPATRFRPGADLRATKWGRALPLDWCADAADGNERIIKMRVVRGGKRCVSEVRVGAARRGRKPKSTFTS